MRCVYASKMWIENFWDHDERSRKNVPVLVDCEKNLNIIFNIDIYAAKYVLVHFHTLYNKV